MAVSSCNKEVATRLFRMLAVNEQTATAVKRDHASYAKLSLLTQQMNLLQQQAQKVVDKSEVQVAKQARVDEGENDAPIGISEVNAPAAESRLALSSEYDEGAKRLLSMITVNEKTVMTVARDQTACAKLSILAEQVGLLQEQAAQCVDEAELNKHLTDLGATVPGTRLVCGTEYYHYTQHGQEVISRIAHDEWTNYDEYHGKFLYDYDFTFRKLTAEDGAGIDVLSGANTLLLQRAHESKTCAQEAAGGAAAEVSHQRATPVLSRW